MKKLFGITLAIMMIASMFAANVSATRDLTYTAPKGTPTIDGKIDDIWDNAEWTNVDLPYAADDDTFGGHALRVKLMWDDTNLYILGEMTCPNVEGDKCITEIYIDELNNSDGYDVDDTQIGFNQNGVIDSYGTNSRYYDCESAGVITETGYIVESSILFSEIKPAEGTQLGLEFMANIQPDGVFAQAFRWNVDTNAGDPAPWQSTSAWGTLVLGAEPTAAEETTAAAEETTAAVEETTVIAEETTAAAEETTEETTAPQTGDYTAIAAVVAAAALAGVVVATKKHRA